MGRRLTVTDLMNDIRSLLDEESQYTLESADILSALNRAQDYSADTIAKQYPEILLTYETLTLTNGTSEYDLPEDIFQDHLEKVEVLVDSVYLEVPRIGYQDAQLYSTTTVAAVPSAYYIFGDQVAFVPVPSGAYAGRIWYLKDPLPLVQEHGRITKYSDGDQYLYLDGVSSNLSTEYDELGSYVNLIDGDTGRRKGSLQVRIITDNRIDFRTSPVRSSVNGLTVTGDLASLNPAPDDYLCSIEGTCIPFRKKPISNFLIQMSVADLSRKLDGDAELADRLLARFEKTITSSWAGRPTTLRIADRNSKMRRKNKLNWWR